MSVKKVAAFLRDVSNHRGGGKLELILHHLSANYRKSAIWSDDAWAGTVDETASTIYEQAREHTASLGNVQRFVCNAYDRSEDSPTERDVPFHSVAFKIEPQNLANDSDSVSSEPATSEGLLGQLMRHNNELHRQSTHAMGTLTYHLARTVEKQSDQIEKLMADRIGTIEVMEELMSRKHDREISTQQTQAKISRDKELFEKIMQLGPVILNKLAGKEIVRQKDTILESVVVQFMDTIKPEHLDRIADSGVLDRQQMILFSTILEQVTKRMVALDERAKSQQIGIAAATNQPTAPDAK